MPLNKSQGEMYPWVDMTWTVLNGACSHECSYCYVQDLKRYPALDVAYSGPPRLVEADLDLNLGEGKTIFICSTSDLFAEGVGDDIIERVLAHCNDYPTNCYLFQSKNPRRFWKFMTMCPPDTLLGTTIESNRNHRLSKAPSGWERVGWFGPAVPFPRMVSIEPILDFDLAEMVTWIRSIAPEFVSIGADSKGHGLPEPGGDKVTELVNALREFTEVRTKSNLARLVRGGGGDK